MPPILPASRRSLLLQGAGVVIASSLPLGWGAARAQAAALRPTPSQTEGPFYPIALPADRDADLLRNGRAVYTPRQVAWVGGTVTDTQGRPLAGGVVEIWQCDEAGHYHHPGDGDRADAAFQGFGQVTLAGTAASVSARSSPRPTPVARRTSMSRSSSAVASC